MAAVAVTRVINATVMVELAGGTILTDPYFTAHWFMRFDEPIGLGAEELPRLKAIIAGHGAYDHWQPKSLRQYPYRDGTPVYVPSERMARSARKAGLGPVEVLTWGQRRTLTGGLTIRSLPGERITGLRTNSYLVSSEGVNLFVGTEARGLAPIHEIAATHRVDIALLPVNGARLLGRRLVMDLPTAMAAARILGAHTLIPIHYSQRPIPSILRATHGLADLLEHQAATHPRVRVRAPGERTVILSGPVVPQADPVARAVPDR
jgi:L-ascorbate metabolism protein UlaG (beta-lactamase superfamily)